MAAIFAGWCLQGIQAMHIADQRLDEGDQQRHPLAPSRTSYGSPATDCRAADAKAAEAPTNSALTEKCRYCLHAIIGRERRIKDHRQPVDGHDRPSTISNPCGVCIQLLEARIQKVEMIGTQRHHAGGEKVQPRPHAVPAEKHHPEEARFQKKMPSGLHRSAEGQVDAACKL